MADYISQVKLPNNTIYDFRDKNLKVYTGSCSTAAGTAIKDVTTDGAFSLVKGAVIFVNFTNTNTAAVDGLKLRVNSTAAADAKPIKHEYNATESNLPGVGYLRANQTYQFYYDGTNWVTDVGRDANSTYSYMRPYEATTKGSYSSQGANPAKIGAAGWKFQLSAGKYFMYSHYYDNTAQSALTLNIGSTGAKPIYINGQPSSASNYTLPGGQYLVYYDETNYYFRTDNKMTGNITGDAATVSGGHTVGKNVPSDAVFTDTTYSAATNGGLSLSGTAFSIASSGVTNAMLAGSIANEKLTHSKVTIAGNDVSLGGSLGASTLVSSLGLSKAMRFLGAATVAITDGGTEDPKVGGNATTLVAGDVIIDKDSSREYVWSTTGKWELLGGDASYWVSSIGTTAQFWRGDNTWSDTISGGTLKIVNNSITLTIGARNSNWVHFENDKSKPYYFDHQLNVSGGFKVYDTNTSLTNNNLTFAQGGGWYMNDDRWIRTVGSKSVYMNIGTFRNDGTTQLRTLQHINANIAVDGRWTTGATGTANSGDGNTTQGTLGTSILEIGNETARPAAGTAGGANNSKGYLYIYGAGSGYGELSYNDSMFVSNKSIYLTNTTNSGISNEIRGITGANDYWRVAGGATASNAGYMEIATGDDANEPIYARQYTGVFTTLKRTATLLDASGNTEFPVQVTAPKFIGALQGNADTATSANQVLRWSKNEIAIGADATPANATNDTVWFNYRSGYGGATNDAATQLTKYYFGDRKGQYNTTTVYAGTFSGNASSATKIALTTAAPTSSKIVGYIPFSTAITGNNDLYAQDSLYLYDTVASNAISATYLNVGKGGTIRGGLTLHSATNNYHGDLIPATLGASRTWTLPNATGTIALTSSNVASADSAKWLMNRGATTGTNAVTIADSNWNPNAVPSGHTAREIVWKQQWKEAGLTYTASDSSEKTNNDTADMRLWLSSSNTANTLQVNMDIDGQIYAIGGFRGNLTGNASGIPQTATSTAAWRKVLLTGGDTYAAWDTAVTSRNGQAYQAAGVAVQPSTGAMHISGPFTTSSTTASTNTATGALIVGGGAGIAGDLHIGGSTSLGGQTIINYTTPASSAKGSSQLQICDSSTSAPAAAIELRRGAINNQNGKASWQIINDSALKFAVDYSYSDNATSQATTYNHTILTLDYKNPIGISVNGGGKFTNGLTVGGQILTSFKSSVAMGSYCSAQTTIPNLLQEVRYSSGCAGSFNLTTAYTLNNVTLATGWYNFMYIPHRSGGVNGTALGDNCNYGVLYLHGMNVAGYADYILSYASEAVKLLDLHASFQSAITDGQILVADGTLGHIKTSGYTASSFAPSSTISCTAANVKSALGTDTSITNKWLNQKGEWSTPTAAQVGAATSGHTHAASLNATGTATINMAANTTYTLTMGGNSVIFKTPADGNTDTKVNVTLGTTTKAYLLGTSTTPTSTATGVTTIADTGVYLDTTAGVLTATTFKGALSGNATTASKITNLTATDAASNSDVWRRVWISYTSNTEGRPAYTDNFCYQTSTNTLKAGKYLIDSKARLEYNSTDDSIDFIFI